MPDYGRYVEYEIISSGGLPDFAIDERFDRQPVGSWMTFLEVITGLMGVNLQRILRWYAGYLNCRTVASIVRIRH
jgi:hypothetical protein